MARIDIGKNIISPKTVPATVEGFYQLTDDAKTIRICRELEEAREAWQQGRMTEAEYKRLKTAKKRGCYFYTPHAHFKKGYKRSDCEPVDSGMAVVDLDGCTNFEQLYAEHLKGREKDLGVNMVNRSVSGTGGHVLFDIPAGMNRQQAQAWMAHELGDVAYDKAVHELERAIYIPCRAYILYLDEERMFSDEVPRPTPPAGHPSRKGEEAGAEIDPSKSPRQGRLAGAEIADGNSADASSEQTPLPDGRGQGVGL